MKGVGRYIIKAFGFYAVACLMFFLFELIFNASEQSWLNWVLYIGIYTAYTLLLFYNNMSVGLTDKRHTEMVSRNPGAARDIDGSDYMWWKGFAAAAVVMVPVWAFAILHMAGVLSAPWARISQMIYLQLFVLYPQLPAWALTVTPAIYILVVGLGYCYASTKYVSMQKALEAHEKKRHAKVLRRKRKKRSTV